MKRFDVWKQLTMVAMMLMVVTWTVSARPPSEEISIAVIGTYESGIFDDSAAEIVAHDPATQRLFVTNAANGTVDILDISDPTDPQKIGDFNVGGGGPNSVAVRDGVVAVAVEADPQTGPGTVAFYDTNGSFLDAVQVGSLPDMLTFTPNGDRVLVANEGEPDGGIDPVGSISIIDLRGGVEGLSQSDVSTAGFSGFNADIDTLRADGVRIFTPGATVAEDLEPEYIAVSHDSRTAWVTLQENNALAIVDVRSATVTDIVPLGFKDHSVAGQGLDPSDRDSGINIAPWPVFGMYQPDAIASFKQGGATYLVTANEGDARGFEEERVEDLFAGPGLDPAVFPAGIETQDRLGRLEVTNTLGNTDADAPFEELYAFGSRSFSIWSASGDLVYDSGDLLEQLTAVARAFNNDNDENDFDGRSDAKGPEPEGVTVAKLFGRTYAFVALERVGGIVVVEIIDPAAPEIIQYINNRDFGQDPEEPGDTPGDLGPESLIVIQGEDSPTGEPLLAVANEVSGTTTLYRISK